MTDTVKILGQVYPAATTLTTGYTVPASTSTIISSITVCNQSNTTIDTIRISVQIAGAADNSKQYLYGGNIGSGFPIGPLNNFTCTLGLSLATTDVIKIYSTNGTSSFNIFGVEIT